jgi:hypothetical protein
LASPSFNFIGAEFIFKQPASFHTASRHANRVDGAADNRTTPFSRRTSASVSLRSQQAFGASHHAVFRGQGNSRQKAQPRKHSGLHCNPSESPISNKIFGPTLDRKNSLGRGMIGRGIGKGVCSLIPLPNIPLPIFPLPFCLPSGLVHHRFGCGLPRCGVPVGAARRPYKNLICAR